LRSTVGLLLAPISGGYKLRIHAAAFDQLAPLTVQAVVNGKEVGSFEAGELQEYVLDVADDVLTNGANLVEFRYPRAARPTEVVKGSTDDRQLAMRLYAIALTPAAR
jgi:hypothetical protein